jgi:hypothetical protein
VKSISLMRHRNPNSGLASRVADEEIVMTDDPDCPKRRA